MLIKELFEKRIDRPIEGVIKADDDEHLFDEIDEYVITNEINQRLTEFLEYYNDYQGVNGAWISGFFGSGKSHLLKVLSYVLENRLLLGDLPAAEIFLEKLKDDALLKGSMEKAISIPSRSILFNIDQKADVVSKKQADAVLSVFMKVFNELRGYDPKIPHIAQFEHDMDRQGCYEEFKQVFEEVSGEAWEEAREHIWLETGDFAVALSRVRNISEEEAGKVLDRYEESYQLSIEDFAEQVKEYIDSRERGFRLNFFVDEVGQYIADNVKLMTNLQTIAESLATKCRGQAWIIVTSQEDMDDVIGELGKQQSNDFSKIQDRLHCRMKLTSKNVAEVIQKRLLEKKPGVVEKLVEIYEKEKNNLKTLFEFSDAGRSYRHFHDEEDFIACYPFMPFHFEMLQSSIKGLSDHNAFEGKFRSVGERSMLGIFQEVGKRISEEPLGRIASYDLMYDGLQTALKSQIQSDINKVEQNPALPPLAVRVLKALLLVKYVQEFKATPRNLSVLLIDHFDIDPIEHEKDVQKALDLLERDTFLRRNGDVYEYLTDEEKDIESEIKEVDIDQSEINKLLVDIIYHSIVRDSKIRYDEKEQDYSYNRLLDDAPFGHATHDLSINVITPLHKNYGDEKAQSMRSMQGDELVVMLGEDARLTEDLRIYVKTEKYCRIHRAEATKENIRRILSEKAMQNEELHRDLETRIREALSNADFFLRGETLEITPIDPRSRVFSAFQYLVSYTYPNLKMLERGLDEKKLQRILTDRDGSGLFDPEETLSEAEKELMSYLQRKKHEADRVTVKSVIDDFGRPPYGWWQAGSLCVLAKLVARGKVDIKRDSDYLDSAGILAALKNTREHGNAVVELRTTFSTAAVQQLKRIHQELFNEPNTKSDAKEVALAFEARLKEEVLELEKLQSRAMHYPFSQKVDAALQELKKFTGKDYTFYLNELKDFKDHLLELQHEIVESIKNFINGPKSEIHDSIDRFLTEQEANFSHVNEQKLADLRQLMASEDLFKNNNIQEAKKLKEELQSSIEAVLEDEKQKAMQEVERKREELKNYPEYSRLEEDQCRKFEASFEQKKEFLEGIKFVFRVREAMEEFKNKEFPDMIQRLQNLTKGHEGYTGRVGQPRETKPIIPIDKVKVSIGKKLLTSEAEVDEYLRAYRGALIDELKHGKNIYISD